MNTFTPIFSDIVDSSVWEEPYHVRIAWLSMLAKRDSGHVVYCDAWKLHKWANITVEEAEDALRVLSSPDLRKHGQEHDGRRIQKVDGGWLILNGAKYEAMMRKIAERARKAKWARENRNKLPANGTPLPGETAYVQACKAGDEEAIKRLEG